MKKDLLKGLTEEQIAKLNECDSEEEILKLVGNLTSNTETVVTSGANNRI